MLFIQSIIRCLLERVMLDSGQANSDGQHGGQVGLPLASVLHPPIITCELIPRAEACRVSQVKRIIKHSATLPSLTPPRCLPSEMTSCLYVYIIRKILQ